MMLTSREVAGVQEGSNSYLANTCTLNVVVVVKLRIE